MSATAPIFKKESYVILPALLQQPRLGQFYRHACQSAQQGKIAPGDEQVPGTPYCYKDFLMDCLLLDLQPAVEQAAGLQLFPTYSYFRVYKHGDALPKHTDRESCEISITLCLGSSEATPWPIWIEGPHSRTAAALAPGDAMLYRGQDCPHWREAFAGQQQAQVFLHYVDQNGPFADWKFDKHNSIREHQAALLNKLKALASP